MVPSNPAPEPAPPASREMRPGGPTPLGATFNGRGTNFSLFSSMAEPVDLCVFAEQGAEERIELTEIDGHQPTSSDDNRSWNCGVEGPTDDAEPSIGRTVGIDAGPDDTAGLSKYVTDGRRIVLLSDGQP